MRIGKDGIGSSYPPDRFLVRGIVLANVTGDRAGSGRISSGSDVIQQLVEYMQRIEKRIFALRRMT
jgi:hypothetical protein